MSTTINSVPMLTNEWRVQGYVWLVRGAIQDEQGHFALPVGAQYIGAAMGKGGEGILVATSDADVIWTETMRAEPWIMQTHNDAAGIIPFATLDSTGRYAHLESFRMNFDESPEQPALQWCTFFCGQTTGRERLCPE